MGAPARYIRFFEQISASDLSLVGGKTASLGEMYQTLRPLGVLIPNGFAITTDAYRDMLQRAQAWQPLHELLAELKVDDPQDLTRRAQRAREIVYAAGLPEDLRTQILAAYRRLREESEQPISVAVRSSATAEDLPTMSFAGQQDSFLNIQGEARLLDACRRCFASLFTDRAIHYRVDNGFDHFKVALSIAVQKMVRADLAASGVMFTLDTESGFRDVVLITGSYGLGENIVQGAVEPDEFVVFKPTFLTGRRAVLRHTLGRKQIRMIYAEEAAHEPTLNVATTPEERERFCLSDEEVLVLADYAIKIEQHYSRQAKRAMPMDIEWAKDGIDGHLYIVQARPETSASRRRETTLEEYRLGTTPEPIVTGYAVGARIAGGTVRLIKSVAEIGTFRPGEVLVTDSTTPDWEPIMHRAAAIVTNRGGRTCHAAIVAREFGIPAVVGTANATERLSSGQFVTVSCAEGELGRVYAGKIPFEIRRTDLATLARPHTKMMLILANPATAFQMSFLPNDGVALARMEFIITEHIKAHPMALLHPDRVADESERGAIEALTRGYAHARDFFVQRLSEGLGTIAAAFYPKPVIVRMSDFKSNEYAGLLGGRWFEPKEENPMLGLRGAARYTHPSYAEGFALECAAIQRARDNLGLVNITPMIPFCRRLEEGAAVLARMRDLGLERGRNGLEVYVMCEIPNNVLLIDEFSRLFDGFSIGSNDLTQLTLGVDRDSASVAFDFDERDPGVRKLLKLAVEGCRRNGRHSGICGQAPSDYPEITAELVRLGIDSIGLNPDALVPTTLRVLELEREMASAPKQSAA